MKLKKSFILKLLFIALISISIILPPSFFISTLKAGSLNFDFEDGLNQWTAYGDVTTTGAKTINTEDYEWIVEPNSSAMAQLVPSGSSGVIGTIFDTLGLSEDSKNYIIDNFPQITNCAYIYRDISLEAGQTISMAWNYISTDYVPFNDASLATFVNLDNASKLGMINGYFGEAGILGATVPGTGNYSTGSYGSTGWQKATFRAVSAGTYRLGFVVYNLDDTILSPYLFLDDPEGLTWKNGEPFDPINPDGEAPPPPAIKSVTFSSTVFEESSNNDGSISTTSTITLIADTFTGNANDELQGVSYSNLPAGLTAHVIKTSDTTATLSFTGKASSHSTTCGVGNFTVTFANSAFAGNDASNIAGSTTDYLQIKFINGTYTLNYTAGSHGSITGELLQSVEEGNSGTAVTAVADKGYHFTKWSDGVKTASRTDKNIKTNINVTALFSINYTVPANQTSATYIVQHYKQDANGEYILSETETFTGNIGQTVNARAKTYAGYELNSAYEGSVPSGTVLSDNSLILKLYYDKTAKLIVKVEDNNIGFNIEGVDKNINIAELNNENVSKVIITLQVNILNTESLSKDVIKKAAELMQKEGLTPYNYFDLSLIKSVIGSDGNVIQSTVLNSDIKGELTIRIPVPDDLKNTDNLAIVFVNDEGEVQVLKTDIVTIDGKKYLEFKTSHFSIYGIVQTEKSYAWIWIIAGAVIIAAGAILIYKRKKQNE
ncbi:MAG: hypothetical protein GYA50_08215 [Eubacteriaceae bacterium]|nr:hypothetical protein [Eubacteriaceae bacterium]